MPIGFALAAGFTAVLLGTAAAAAVNRHEAALRLAVVAGFVALPAALSATLAGATCAAGMGWLFTNGFLVNRGGDLAWRGTPDLVRAAALAAAASAGLAVGRVWQRRHAGGAASPDDRPAPIGRVTVIDAHRTGRLLPWPRGSVPPGFWPIGPRRH